MLFYWRELKMEGKLHSLELHGVEGMSYAKFKFEKKNGDMVQHDEMLRIENRDDTTFLYALQDFVNAKLNERK